jgi:hypothetical protein
MDTIFISEGSPMDELLLSMEYFDIVDEDGKPTGEG